MITKHKDLGYLPSEIGSVNLVIKKRYKCKNCGKSFYNVEYRFHVTAWNPGPSYCHKCKIAQKRSVNKRAQAKFLKRKKKTYRSLDKRNKI